MEGDCVKICTSNVLVISVDPCHFLFIFVQNIHLSHSDSFVFVDVSSTTQELLTSSSSALRLIYDQVSAALSSEPRRRTLVMLDDITTLEWIGVSTLDLTRFARALRALCLKASFLGIIYRRLE
jgi:hypothetical protein